MSGLKNLLRKIARAPGVDEYCAVRTAHEVHVRPLEVELSDLDIGRDRERLDAFESRGSAAGGEHARDEE